MTLAHELPIAVLFTLAMSSASAAQQPVKRIADEFKFLGSQWPDVGAPHFVAGGAVEFRDGKIELGTDGLQRIMDEASKAGANSGLAFIIAHEAWHSVQARRYPPNELQSLRSSRVLECEADFMGAFATARQLASTGAPVDESQAARSNVEQFVQTGAEAQSDASFYLSPENRAKTISLGWHLALNRELFKSLGPAKPETVARRTCEMLANVNDGSLGRVSLMARNELGTASNPKIALNLTNYSKRPVVASYMLVETLWTPGGPKSAAISNIFFEERKLAPNAKEVAYYPLALANRTGELTGIPELWTMMAPAIGGLVTTHYAAETPPDRSSYCYARLVTGASSADRELFTRVATLALGASDDFKTVRVEPGADQGYGMKTYQLSPTVSRSTFDGVMISNGIPSASLVALDSKSEQQVRDEYGRLKRFVMSTCPGMAEERTDKNNEPSLWISNFAPNATASLHPNVWRIAHTGSGDPSPGGLVEFMIFKAADE